jgi:hypothetical protein
MKISTLHIWMNIPSFHQNDLFNELNHRFEKFEVVYAHAHDTHKVGVLKMIQTIPTKPLEKT